MRLPVRWHGDARLVAMLGARLCRPVSLASADLNEDGLPDLVTGYATPDGAGVVAVRQRRPDPPTPFEGDVRVFATPARPDVLAAGDFDADGHLDVLAAESGGTILALLRGDGSGRLHAPALTPLSGRITAIAIGDIDRPDGLADVTVGIAVAQQPTLLIFSGPSGAMRSTPERISLPAAVGAITVADLDRDGFADIAAAAKSEMAILRGCSEAAVPGTSRRRHVERHALLFDGLSLVAGEFTGDAATDLALLAADGTARILDPASGRESAPASPPITLPRGTVRRNALDAAAGGDARVATMLIAANISAHRSDDLVLYDAAGGRLVVLTLRAGGSTSPGDEVPASEPTRWSVVPLAMGISPVAVLPMRLNGDALDDLVLIDPEDPDPAFALTSPSATFTVTNTNDNGVGSLRQAMLDAEASAGADAILFSIPGPGPHTIAPTSALPVLSDPVTIDGSSEPDFDGRPIVEIAGHLAGTPRGGIDLVVGDSVVRGLIINRFGGSGIVSEASRRNRFEGNFIGTDVSGALDRGNAANGIELLGGSENTIGGTTPASRNVIAGNDQNGVLLLGTAATSNLVQGNFIGVDVTGTSRLGNSVNGVQVNGAFANAIGGTLPGARNVISSNGSGVHILGSGANNNIVQGNFVGTGANGTTTLGNGFGVFVSDFSFSTIGGTTPAARNVISGNNVGVTFRAASGPATRYRGTSSAPMSAAPLRSATSSESW